MKDRIRKLLINGLKGSEISSIVGCSPSYVSQLLKDESYKASVEEGMIAAQTERTEEDHIDNRYQSLEHKLITAAEGALAEASLGEITRALETINKRADQKYARKNPAAPLTSISVNVVSLQLPAHALPNSKPAITINDKQEIIAIDGKALAPMSSDGVKNLFAARAAIAQQRIADATILQEM